MVRTFRIGVLLMRWSGMCMPNECGLYFFFFFNDTATTEIYTLSLHDALPISANAQPDALS